MWANVLTVVLFNAFLFYTLKNNVNEKTKSLDFPVNRLFMKLFKTSNIQMVNDCQVYFGFDLPSVITDRQSKKFLSAKCQCFLVKSI